MITEEQLKKVKRELEGYKDEKLKAEVLLDSINKEIKEKEEELEKAIEALNEAKNIYIYSVGVSSLVGMDFYYKLSRINKRCIAHNDTHLQLTSSALMEKGDVAVAISYSGETKEVLKCVENARKEGVKVISITKASIDNTLANSSDIVLRVPFVEKSLREGAMSSRISQLAIIDMLFLGMARTNLKEVEDKLRVTRKAVEDFKVKDKKYDYMKL